jgi:hypothetical protein
MRTSVMLSLVILVLSVAACDGGGSGESAVASSAPSGISERIDRLEKLVLDENRRFREEMGKLLARQQETDRTHLEEVSEDLQFQMGKLLQRVGRLERHVVELLIQIKKHGTGGPAPEEAAREKLYTAEMRQEIAKRIADRGIVLKDDRVEVNGIIGPGRAAPLEYFAVLRGGNEHEAVVIVTGAYGLEERLPKGLASALNLACQALNLPRGTPTRYIEGGEVVPATGEAIHMYVQWEQDGKTVLARAEDFVFNETTNKAMDPDTWIFVGSRFIMNVGTGQEDFMSDINGSIAATFGCENAILANASPEASDVNQSNFFRGYAPRIPPLETPVKLVISRTPLEANAVFTE